jgi:hypothetical protein
MRRFSIVATLALLLAVPAVAVAAQHVTATPKTVKRADTQTVRGSGWPVIEFCSRTVRAYVKSAQNVAPIAQRHIGDDGRFTFRWVPKNKNIGRGDWKLVVKMRCESGDTGATRFVRAATPITIK